jgi:hypothetical protein
VNRGNWKSLAPALDTACKSESEQPTNDIPNSNIMRTTNFQNCKACLDASISPSPLNLSFDKKCKIFLGGLRGIVLEKHLIKGYGMEPLVNKNNLIRMTLQDQLVIFPSF